MPINGREGLFQKKRMHIPKKEEEALRDNREDEEDSPCILRPRCSIYCLSLSLSLPSPLCQIQCTYYMRTNEAAHDKLLFFWWRRTDDAMNIFFYLVFWTLFWCCCCCCCCCCYCLRNIITDNNELISRFIHSFQSRVRRQLTTIFFSSRLLPTFNSPSPSPPLSILDSSK